MLSISHPSLFALSLSLSFSFIRPFLSHHLHHHQFRRLILLLLFFLISLWWWLVVFNLSPLCIEKYFLSWHLLSWCLQNLNPFCSFIFLVMFLNRILYSVCVVWSMRSPKAFSWESFLFPLSIIVNVVVVKITAVRGEIVLFWKMYLRLCGFLTAIICFFFSVFLWENATPTNLGIPLPNYLTIVAHPDTPRNRRRRRTPPCWQLDWVPLAKERIIAFCDSEVWPPNDKWPNESRSGHSPVDRLLLMLLFL